MTPAEYCPDCRRIVGVGCACGMSFGDKARSQALHLGTFRAVRS